MLKETLKLYGSIFILVLGIPYLLTVYFHGSFWGQEETSPEAVKLEQQLVGIVAEQMPVTFELEALMAQAVIARTNLYQGEELTAWETADMREHWGDQYENYRKKMEEAVTKTAGEILTYEGIPIQAEYHMASVGQTRNGTELPGQEDCVYARSVESPWDLLADGYLHVEIVDKQQLRDTLSGLFPGELPKAEDFPEALEITRDQVGYATKVKCGSAVVNGEAVRSALELPSACFYFVSLGDQVRILAKGIGHGLGFSQFGANEQAKNGETYEQLLHYYYPDVKIQKCQADF